QREGASPDPPGDRLRKSDSDPLRTHGLYTVVVLPLRP
ncbi:hypothetical protein QTP70_005274, partial [Hemibagrus guttatus]